MIDKSLANEHLVILQLILCFETWYSALLNILFTIVYDSKSLTEITNKENFHRGQSQISQISFPWTSIGPSFVKSCTHFSRLVYHIGFDATTGCLGNMCVLTGDYWTLLAMINWIAKELLDNKLCLQISIVVCSFSLFVCKYLPTNSVS